MYGKDETIEKVTGSRNDKGESSALIGCGGGHNCLWMLFIPFATSGTSMAFSASHTALERAWCVKPGPLACFRRQPGELSLCGLGLRCRSRPANFYFFGGAMLSFAALATRNLTTVLALILIVSPV